MVEVFDHCVEHCDDDEEVADGCDDGGEAKEDAMEAGALCEAVDVFPRVDKHEDGGCGGECVDGRAEEDGCAHGHVEAAETNDDGENADNADSWDNSVENAFGFERPGHARCDAE